jgi:hypothetical protein
VCIVCSNILASTFVIHLFSDVHTLSTLAIVEVKSGSQVVEASEIYTARRGSIEDGMCRSPAWCARAQSQKTDDFWWCCGSVLPLDSVPVSSHVDTHQN